MILQDRMADMLVYLSIAKHNRMTIEDLHSVPVRPFNTISGMWCCICLTHLGYIEETTKMGDFAYRITPEGKAAIS